MTLIRRRYVELEHGQLHFRELGEGPPLVLLHKTPSSSIQYLRVMPLLAQRFRTIALDTPGFGMSDPPPSEPTMADYGRIMAGFLDALELDAVDLLGHHTGASIAIELAATRPERVKRLVLGGVLAFDDEAVRAEWRTFLDEHKFELDDDGSFLETYPKPMLSRDQEFSPEDPERYWLELVAYLQAGPRFWWSYNAVVEHRAFDLLASLRAPTLVLNQRDGRVRESTQRIAAALPGATYLELPGSSEGVMDAPEDFSGAVLEFLA
jgi:pimeloyl-ACP methyl ester carboxylesterase